jgi:hypothetical protein
MSQRGTFRYYLSEGRFGIRCAREGNVKATSGVVENVTVCGVMVGRLGA